MLAVKPARQHSMPVQTLLDRLELCQKDEVKLFAQLDIGEFPESSSAASEYAPELGSDEKFHFLKWLHGSDLAIVEHVKHGRRVLKIAYMPDLMHIDDVYSIIPA